MEVIFAMFYFSGDDRWGYEKASERWLPVHTVETILVSVISMLADPNDEYVYIQLDISHYLLELLLNT